MGTGSQILVGSYRLFDRLIAEQQRLRLLTCRRRALLSAECVVLSGWTLLRHRKGLGLGHGQDWLLESKSTDAEEFYHARACCLVGDSFLGGRFVIEFFDNVWIEERAAITLDSSLDSEL